MLKWTVANRRETIGESGTGVPRRPVSSSCGSQRRSIGVLRERKQRRRSSRRASLCLRSDKENQFSTPNSTTKFTDTLYPGANDSKALRDVSNITPKTHLVNSKTTSSTPHNPVIRQRKKQCLNPSHVKNYDINELKTILLDENKCNGCEPNYASTLPVSSMRNTKSLATINPNTKSLFPYQSLTSLPQFKNVLPDNTPNKKLKIDHVNDFLHQISFITSPEDYRIRNVQLNDRYNEVSVSPLLRKISDLRFSRISYDEKLSTTNDDSSAFNDMSLDKIVDAILDTTPGSERLQPPNTIEHQNEQNQVSEDNFINKKQEIYNRIHFKPDRNELETGRNELETDRNHPEIDITHPQSDRINLERDRTYLERDRTYLERDRTNQERDRTNQERDRNILEDTGNIGDRIGRNINNSGANKIDSGANRIDFMDDRMDFGDNSIDFRDNRIDFGDNRIDYDNRKHIESHEINIQDKMCIERYNTSTERNSLNIQDRSHTEISRTNIERYGNHIERDRTPIEGDRIPIEGDRIHIAEYRSCIEGDRSHLEVDRSNLEVDRSNLEVNRSHIEIDRSHQVIRRNIREDRRSIEKIQMNLGGRKHIEEVRTNIREIRTDIEGVRTDIEGVRTGIEGVRTDIEGVRTDIEGVRTDIEGFRRDIGVSTDMGGNYIDDRIMIRVDEEDTSKRKRVPSYSEVSVKKRNTEFPEFDSSFALKRQKCIRRRRGLINPINNNVLTEDLKNDTPKSVFVDERCFNVSSSCFKESSNDVSFSSSCTSNDKNAKNDESMSLMSQECLAYSSWEKDMCCGLSTPFIEHFQKDMVTERKRTLRRSFSSPITVAASSTPTRSRDSSVNGNVDLQISYKNGKLIVHVFRCRDLYRGSGKPINAYVKVSLMSESGCSRVNKKPGLQRTAVQAESCNPVFDHEFSFWLCKADLVKRVLIEVWHRDRGQRRSEFLGCMSFPVKYAVKKDVNGTYKLLPQSSGRTQNQPITKHHCTTSRFDSPDSELLSVKKSDQITVVNNMGDNSQSSVEEVISIDDIDSELTKKTTDKTSLHQQQKDADENLFLRYLELDPMEGPEAVASAQQRKAIGNKSGRTPFTTTKKLTRGGKTGFGFSVVWTHPPRIERVEKNMPADKAGILPGDYIIFVDKHNVVMMPEIDILNLIRSYGNTLTLEIFRRSVPRNGSVTAAKTTNANGSEATIPSVTFQTQHRPSTGCSNNTAASVDYSRRRLHLPQVTFTSEKPSSTPEEARKRAMYQLINKEQQYATALQFAVTRFVSALTERRDLISPQEHHLLFQNAEELLRITEDIIESLVHDDGEPQIQLLPKTYESKLYEITTAYKRYCAGLKRADCVLAAKTKNQNSEFVRFLQSPAVPRRRPDVTSFIHRPLEHYRDILKLLSTILSNTKSNQEDYSVISHVVNEMQTVYREITSEGGLMEPVGEGRPLLSVQDLENRLVFTKCKPFVLSKPGRQWIFGGDLSRVEGRTTRTYWALLFSDMLLFAKVSRDRVLFITEEPLPLAQVTEIYFNVRKKATEFRITVEPGGKKAQSPTVHCGPDLSRTPRKNSCKRCVVLRAPTMELKAVWQNLLQRQLFQVNCGLDGSSMSSPLDSPDVPITCSVATLQSAESLSIRRQGQNYLNSSVSLEMQKHLDELIEHKCKQLSKTCNNKGGAIHLEQWMKGQLGNRRSDSPEEEPEPEVWTEEELRQRTAELKLSDSNITQNNDRCEELVLSDHDQSPSRSTTTESQVTVKSSPVVPEQVSLCKQCHETCLSNNNSPNLNVHHTNNNVIHNKCPTNPTVQNHHILKESHISNEEDNEWGSLMLMGLAAINPTTSLVKVDPFAPKAVPKISVVPPTPDQGSMNKSIATRFNYSNEVNTSPFKRKIISNLDLVKDHEDSPDDSPQNEPPYYALGNCNQALKRYGTLSSLEKLTTDEISETLKNSSESESEDEDRSTNTDPGQTAFTQSFKSWTTRAGNFVSEKMKFFESFTEENTQNGGAGFFERYLRHSEIKNTEENEHLDEETSAATSGEEIWGTPTSGGEMEDPLTFPNSDGGNVSPQSASSLNGDDDTELMMDELLMAPPVISSAMRGLLPRRRLEPLMEEDDTDDTYTSSSSSEKITPSPEEGYGTGVVADNCSDAALPRDQNREEQIEDSTKEVNLYHMSPVRLTSPQLARSQSYRNIIEEAEEMTFFNRYNPQQHPIANNTKNFDTTPPTRPKTKLARRSERRVHESYQGSKPALKVFSKETNNISTELNDQKPLSPMLNKDKQLDRRFWKQLSKRRRGNRSPQLPA